MSSRMKTTHFYFLIFAVLSSFVIFMSFKWKVTENVYRISSQISQVKIAGVFYSDVNFKESTGYKSSSSNSSKIIVPTAFNRLVKQGHDPGMQDNGKLSSHETVTSDPLSDYVNAVEYNVIEAALKNYSTSELHADDVEAYGDFASYKDLTVDNSNTTAFKHQKSSTSENVSVVEKLSENLTSLHQLAKGSVAEKLSENLTSLHQLAKSADDKKEETNFQIIQPRNNLKDSFKTDYNSVTKNESVIFVNNTNRHKSVIEMENKTKEPVTKLYLMTEHSNSTFNDKRLSEITKRIEQIKSHMANKNSSSVELLIEGAKNVSAQGINLASDIIEFKRLRNNPKRYKSTKILKQDRLANEQVFTVNNVSQIRGNVVTAQTTEVSPRPDNCKQCFKSNFQKIINEPDLCKSNVDILILVTSSFSNIEARNAIRSTWCKICNSKMSNIKYLFVFGSRHNMTENAQLLEESKTYRDIIQMDFYDSYANLTYKTISALQWSKDHCQKAKFVMKTDDDMYVNTELLQHLLKVAPTNKLIGGQCWGPSSPFRDSNSKWYVSLRQYQHPFFPSMCSGTGYIMTSDVVAGILRQSPNVPFFHLEDVYVAICVQRLGIRPKQISGFRNILVDFDACTYRNKLFTSHGFNARTLKYVWQQIQTCATVPVKPYQIYFAVTV